MREPLELRIRHQRHRAHQAASDARVTKAVSTIAVALLLVSSGASATECQSSPGRDGKWWSWRIVNSKRCWYQGRPGRSKDLLQWAKQSPPPVMTRLDPGDRLRPAPPVPPQQLTQIIDPTPKLVPTGSMSAPTTEALQTVPRPPSLPEQPPLPAKPTKPSKWWMLLLIIPPSRPGWRSSHHSFIQRERKDDKEPCSRTSKDGGPIGRHAWQANSIKWGTTSRGGHAARRGQSRSVRIHQARRNHRRVRGTGAETSQSRQRPARTTAVH